MKTLLTSTFSLLLLLLMLFCMARPLTAVAPPNPRCLEVADEDDQPKRCPDLGDAPDSTNHYAMTNTAYLTPAVSGHFPTVYAVPSGTVAGPYHVDTTRVWLGDTHTVEEEADRGVDADGDTNILASGLADTADNDGGDDGWLNPAVPIIHCQPTTLRVRVARAPFLTIPSRLFLNVWFDGNRDGAWNARGNCPNAIGDTPAATQAAEWLVRNGAVDTALIPVGDHLDISVTTALALNTTPELDHWLRFTLSEQPQQPLPIGGLPDGRGPHSGYLVGETEDYRAVGQQPVTITVNSNGTFTPLTVTIRAGQTIRWVNLSTTDSIIQIGDPTLSQTADLCGIADNDLDHPFAASDPNEFTGPTRKGVSGIFVLGPDKQGLVQKLSTDTCRDEAAFTVDLSDGTSYKLCRDGALNDMLDTTWSNPDITGVILRLNWSDIQTDTNRGIVYHWDDLDRQMNKAVENGKLFTLDVSAGKNGTPDWIFTTYTGTVAGPGPVTPHSFQDWGDDRPITDSCGHTMTLGSPTDTNYRDLYVAMLEELADHVAGDSRWFQALAHVKLSGANFLSSEARLPNSCPTESPPDEEFLATVTKKNGDLKNCTCNSQVWAEAGYTPGGLYEYYRVVGNTLYNAFYQRKSLGYQLIEAGFPRVENATNFVGDSLKYTNTNTITNSFLLSPTGIITDDLNGFEQTEMILRDGRYGRFTNPSRNLDDSGAGKLFVPQHSGLGPLPEDIALSLPITEGDPGCSQAVTVDPVTQRAIFPIPTGTRGGDGPGCPNRWAVDEGTLHSQIMGFQTSNPENGVVTAADVESALWNLTINSNGVYLEIYEQIAWQIYHTMGTGPTAALLDENRLGLPNHPAPYSKNVFTWTQELHERRQALVDPTNPHSADPFPTVYQHTFAKAISAPETYYYINPAKCALATELDPEPVGRIIVTP